MTGCDTSATPAPDPGAVGDPAPEAPATKAEWRAWLVARRRARPAPVREAEARGLAEAVVPACVLAHPDRDHTLCAYMPLAEEPGSLALLDALVADGRRVLLPITPPGPVAGDAALDWAPYRGPDSLVTGPFRLRQPAGPGLGPRGVAEAGLVLVPALAVDATGIRLGWGAGWYDRSLPHARPGTALLAVVREEEVVAALPGEPHDVRMTGALTPAGHRTFAAGLP